MTLLIPLWAADPALWLKLIVGAIVVVGWIVKALMQAESPAARQRKAMQRARPIPQPQAGNDKQRIEDEVGEFLRRAAKQRTTKEGGTAPAKEPARPPKPARPPLPQLSDSRSADTSEPFDRPREMGTAIASDLSQRTLVDRDVRPREVDQAVEAMQSHLAQTFDHTVGSFGRPAPAAAATAQSSATDESSVPPASELAAMLRDPQSIREAIVVSEILRRPEERW